MDSTLHSSRTDADRSRDLLMDNRDIAPNETPEWDRQDDVLPYHSSTRNEIPPTPRSWKLLAFETSRLRVLVLVVFGTFLAACPVPRKYMTSYALRQILITFVASLVTFPPLRGRSLSYPKRVLRILIAYFGFYISMFAIFGAADEIRIELRWQSLLWYPIHESYQLGYLFRVILVMVGYGIQKAAGIHSTVRILGTYLLCLAWVYIDAPLTIIDLARGRERW